MTHDVAGRVIRAAAAAVTVALAVALLPCAASAASGGTFAPAQYLGTGSTATNSVAVADVTGDRRPDILVGLGAVDNTQTSSLLVFAQRADHTYGAPQRLAGHGGYNGEVPMATGDVDGDGRTDVAVATSAGIDLFYQRGGRLAAPVLVAEDAEDVALADLTGDGRLDLVLAVHQGEIRVYAQSARSTFSLTSTATGPVRPGVPVDQVFVADFNGDRRPDLAQFYGWGTWVRLRQANGSYGPAVTLLTAPDSAGSRRSSSGAAVGDVTGDGRADLVMTADGNRPDSAVHVFAQRTGGLDPTPAVYPAYDSPSALGIGDLTGDRRNDLVVTHNSWLAVSVHLQQSTGRLGAYRTSTVDGVGAATDALAIGDVTGDGKPDIVSVAYTKVAILRQL